MLKIIVLMSVLMQLVMADWSFNGIKVEHEDNRLTLEKATLYNQEMPEDSIQKTQFGEVTFRQKSYHYEISIPSDEEKPETYNVDIAITPIKSRGSGGPCAASPGIKVDLTINDQLILNEALFHNECYASYDKILIDFDQEQYKFWESSIIERYEGFYTLPFKKLKNNYPLQNSLHHKPSKPIVYDAMTYYYETKPSFNCNANLNEIEKSICDGTPFIKELDKKLGKQYRRLMSKLKPYEQAKLKDTQRKWLRSLAQCKETTYVSPSCLQDKYFTRLSEFAQLKNKVAKE